MIRVVLATKTTPNRRICCLVIMVPIITGLTVDPIKLKIKVTNKAETWGKKYETSQLSKGQGSHFVLSIFTFMIN